MYRYAVPQDNFGQLEKLAAQQNEIALQKAMQPSTGQRLIGAAAGIGHSLLDYDRGRKKREFDERKDLAMRAMSRNDYEFDVNQLNNWVMTGQGPDGGNEIPVKKVEKTEKPPKLAEANEWMEPDPNSPTGFSYVRLTADNAGKLNENRQSISEAAYKNWESKKAATPKKERISSVEANQIQRAGYIQSTDVMGQTIWKPKPAGDAIRALKALRATYQKQKNMDAVDYVDAELSVYNVAPIGTASNDPNDPSQWYKPKK